MSYMNLSSENNADTSLPVCFVIMPIADTPGYEHGHFTKVYEQIFVPACLKAGFVAVRADEVKETNFIHLDILQKLLEAPMVLCDLSSRNPNVLYELGIRQAFDKPVVLVREVGTQNIFDVGLLRYTEYHRELEYSKVTSAQESIASSLSATFDLANSEHGVNSLIRLLSLPRSARLEHREQDPIIESVKAEINDLRYELRTALRYKVVGDVPTVRIPTQPNIRITDSLRQEWKGILEYGLDGYLMDYCGVDHHIIWDEIWQEDCLQNFLSKVVERSKVNPEGLGKALALVHSDEAIKDFQRLKKIADED